MTDAFYFGHTWSWMENFFMVERPSDIDDLHLFVVAEMLHHCYKLNRSTKFYITHATLDKFHFRRHALRRYLEWLQEIELITVEFRYKASPCVELIHKPVKYTESRKG